MKTLKNLPHLLTLSNAFLGSLAIAFASQSQYDTAIWLLASAMFCDFFDGFAARKLKVAGELGKQLDSLADALSFGLAPAFILWHALGANLDYTLLIFISSAGAVLRLARFNLSEDQSTHFIGVPTPAWAFFILAQLAVLNDTQVIAWLPEKQLHFILTTIAVLGAYLMNSSIPFLALKWKEFNWKNLKFKVYFVLTAVAVMWGFGSWGIYFVAVAYALFSILEKYRLSKAELLKEKA